MRFVTLAVLAGGLVLGAPGLQATTKHHSSKSSASSSMTGSLACVYDADREAFDIEGLKSQLMVTAETCGQDAHDKYGTFMTRYHPQVVSAEDDLHRYFNRSYGKTGSKAYDEYMTQLADNQEQVGLKAGTAYCDNLNTMYDEVLSLHDGSELHDYSNSKMLYQPASFTTCSGAPPVVTTAKKSRHSTHAKRT